MLQLYNFTKCCYKWPGGKLSNTIGAGFMKKKTGCDFDLFNPSYYSICLVINGEGDYIDHTGRTHHLTRSSYFQRIPGYVHSNYISRESNWLECFVAVGKTQCDALMEMGFIDPTRPVGYLSNMFSFPNQVLELMNKFDNTSSCFYYDIYRNIINVILDILSPNAVNNANRYNIIVRQVCDYITENLDRRFSMEELSGRFNIGYQSLRKYFRRITGMSMMHYCITKRIEKSIKLLNETDYLISEISDILGYNSVFEFSSQFKQMTGYPPKQHKRSLFDKIIID